MTGKYLIDDRRGLVAATGPDAVPLLQSLVTNDVEKVTPERSVYAALLTAQGRFLHDFFIVHWPDGVVLDCERARQDDLVKRLTLYRLRAKVQFASLNDSHVVALIWGARSDQSDGVALADPRHVALGHRAVLPRTDAQARLAAMGLSSGTSEDYDTLRLSLGVPDGSRDLEVERALLLENNFEALGGVDFNKGCYVGQEITARTKYRGLAKKKLLRVHGAAPLPPPGTIVLRDGKEAGELRSSLGTDGLALLRLDALEGGALDAAGVALTVTP
jgi:folate-binding protein YgfZ